MATKKNLVMSMLMSILTAGIFGFAFAFTACSDDELANANSMEEGSDKIGNYADFEPYGLTYHNFDNADDVQILNADTTEIAVRKSLADKLGITNFENHPLGIWDDPSHLAYGRKALEQKLEGDTYIIKVEGVTAAELIGEKSAQLVTDWYVNEDETLVATRAAYDNIPEYAAKYVDDDGLMSYGQKWFKKSNMELHQSIAYETIRYYTQVWKQKIDASYVFSSEKMGLTYEMERYFQTHVYKFEKILEERAELMKKWDSQ